MEQRLGLVIKPCAPSQLGSIDIAVYEGLLGREPLLAILFLVEQALGPNLLNGIADLDAVILFNPSSTFILQCLRGAVLSIQ